MNLIEVESVKFSYSGDDVLRNANLIIQRGDFVGIVGSNGVGKSTLLKLILGELSAQSGSILLFGEEISKFKSWPKIGYVPQNSSALAYGFPANVSEIVCANLYSKIGIIKFANKKHDYAVRESLDSVGVLHLANRMIGELSGGQLQRVLLARALVAGPEMLILDEPSAGVDSTSTQSLYDLLHSLCKAGITVVMVTHDLQRAALYLNRAYCLARGSLVEIDPSQLEHGHDHP